MKSIIIMVILIMCFESFAYPEELKSLFFSNAQNLINSSEWINVQSLSEDKSDESYRLARNIWYRFSELLLNEKIARFNPGYMNELYIKWDNLVENIDYLWHDESQQRFGDKLSLSKMLSALDNLNSIRLKIENDDDLLIDLTKFKNVLFVPGAAGKIYWWVEKLYWDNNFKKAKEGFEFLLLDENKDDFTVGASHFYLGRMAWRVPLRLLWYPDKASATDDAIYNLLKVHKSSTCFTYIAYSYIFLAEIMYSKGFTKIAKALSLVEVPTIDWMYVNSLRHFNAIKYCQADKDTTNKIKHIQQHIIHCQDSDCQSDKTGVHFYDFDSDLWNYCLSNRFSLYDRRVSINDCFYELKNNDYSDELFSALTHTWPNITKLPDEIANKRALNNNVISSDYILTNNFINY